MQQAAGVRVACASKMAGNAQQRVRGNGKEKSAQRCACRCGNKTSMRVQKHVVCSRHDDSVRVANDEKSVVQNHDTRMDA